MEDIKGLYTQNQNKGILVFLQELGVALQEEWQIPRAVIQHIISSIGHTGQVLHMEVTPHIDLDLIT